MKSDAYIRVTCEQCMSYEDEVQLCATAGGGYDERDVDNELEELGWDTEKEICPECVRDLSVVKKDAPKKGKKQRKS